MSPVIRLETELPGPKSKAINARRAAAIPKAVANQSGIALTHADNALLTDVDGNRLIDFAGGIGVMNVGHRNPALVEAVKSQLDHLTHACFAVSSYESYVALAERLNRLTPGTHEKRTLLVNTGAEGIENAVKIARHATGRPAIVAFEHAFHGRTNLTMALTAKPMPYKKGFGPFAPEVYRVPFSYCYRCQSAGGKTCCQASAAYWERIFAGLVDPTEVAAIVIEPQLGEGGFVPADPGALTALAAFARQHGILFIADEIQTGFGRTGKMFACDHYGLVPDLIVTAKSLAGGLPLAAVTGRAEIMDHVHVGGLGGTYGGNPLACAAAIAVIDVMERDQVLARGQAVAATLRARFEALAGRYQFVGDVRGLGAMLALEIVTDRTSKAPDKARTTRIQAEALKRGLIILTCGTYANVLRVLVPLTVEAAVLAEGLDVLDAAFSAASG
ncbi:MAG: 4-aminobutyrate--2-oxoglutarate transaminase [Gemmatimonadetes bacterium]|nr:4-aminobutyrate--2-oxoglutarate transaminase [Gemmatimonadota bacterium]